MDEIPQLAARPTRLNFKQFGLTGLMLILIVVLMVVLMIVAGLGYGRQSLRVKIWLLERNLAREGFLIEGIRTLGVHDGVREFSIAHVKKHFSFIDIELDDLRLQVSQVNENPNAGFAIAEVTVGDLKVQTAAGFSPESWPKFDPGLLFAELASLPPELTIGAVEVAHGEWADANHRVQPISRISLRDLDLQPSAERVHLSRLWFESEVLTLDLHELTVDAHKTELGATSFASLRPSERFRLLRAPLDVQFNGVWIDGELRTLRLVGCAQRLSVDIDETKWHLAFNGFTPAEYLKTAIPVSSISLRLAGQLKELRPFDLSRLVTDQSPGRLSLRGVRFDWRGTSFVHVSGSKKSALLLKPEFDWFKALQGQEPVWILHSEERELVYVALARLYYGKVPPQLTPTERDIVQRDSVYFSSTADDIAFQKTARAQIHRPPTSLQRLPTSSQKFRLSPKETPDHAAGLAKELPAFQGHRAH